MTREMTEVQATFGSTILLGNAIRHIKDEQDDLWKANTREMRTGMGIGYQSNN